ncbi:MAG: monovalent cation:H+ antiporter-2 CPA2 family [Rhodobacteraceae bacterium]|uniref:cation:proton antiporter domain-containing protein n=1 Tax=Cypionkella sp. TaxID=2811411 RepID=UPI001321CA07|nr:cation:proton antiporter [Cypionkella sp.]KAF0172075.1 MAG: monovalent cation:H+ antiporter-2 CPA2 family [Paracoccaceae bacterium]MDO8326231.1 cation:proton antiporter [Cypionkella sp.]
MESFLLQASIYLGAAVLVVPLAVRLGLGSVLGYLAAGILMGPIFGLAGAETADLQHFAEFGVVLMLFLIGLELEPKALWAMRHKLIGMGGAQVALTTSAVAMAMFWLGNIGSVALILGMMASLSSTAIVLQTLSEKNLMRTQGGRSAFSVLLTQDIAVIPMLAVIPLLALPGIQGPTAGQFGIVNPEDLTAAENAAEPLISIVQSLPGWGAGLLTLAIVAGIVLAGHYLSRPIFRFVHAAKLPEMSTFISLLMVLGIAFLMMLVGLSPALGTFVAGVVLANSEFRHQLEADLKPFKGLLLGLFFMTVGVGINFSMLAREPFTVLGLTLGLMGLKAMILLGISLAFKLKPQDRWLFSLSLAQGGEFGFLIISFARSESALPLAAGQMGLLVISLSMLLTPLLFIGYDWLTAHFAQRQPDHAPDEIDEKGQVIVAGIGRFGQVVNRLVRTSGVPTVVLDSDMTTIETMRKFGVKGFFGDPARPELLEAAGVAEAQVIVVAVDDRDTATRIVRYARSRRPDIHIVARAQDRVHVYELFQAGANDIVRETFDSSIRAGRYVLENMGFSEYEAAKVSQAYYRIDRTAMLDLAKVWVPGQPTHLNEAYIARAKQLDRDLESALMEELHDVRPMAAEDPAEVLQAMLFPDMEELSEKPSEK